MISSSKSNGSVKALLFASVTGVLATVPTPVSAAVVLFETRITGASTGVTFTTKSANVTAEGQTVDFDLIALVRDGDGNAANDGFRLTTGAVRSSNGGLLGSLSNAQLNTTGLGGMLDAGFSNVGSNTDIHSDGTASSSDLDYGALTGSSNYFQASTGLSSVSSPTQETKTGTYAGTYSTFKLASFRFTVTEVSPLTAGDTTDLTYQLRRSSTSTQTVRLDGTNTTITTNGSSESAATTTATADGRIVILPATVTVESGSSFPTRQTLTLVPTSGPGSYVPAFAPVEATTTGFTVGGLLSADASALVKFVLAYSGTTLTAGDFANETSFTTYASLAEMLADNPWVKADAGANSFSTLTGAKFVLLTSTASSQVATLDFTNNTWPTGVTPIRIAAIPEPATLLTTGLISIGLLSVRRRKSA